MIHNIRFDFNDSFCYVNVFDRETGETNYLASYEEIGLKVYNSDDRKKSVSEEYYFSLLDKD